MLSIAGRFVMCHMCGRSLLVFDVFFNFSISKRPAYCAQHERFTRVASRCSHKVMNFAVGCHVMVCC